MMAWGIPNQGGPFNPHCMPTFPPQVLKHRFATASALYAKAVTDHGKPRSTLVLAWQALRRAVQRRMATQRGLFEERMSQRSSRSASVRSPGAAAKQVGTEARSRSA